MVAMGPLLVLLVVAAVVDVRSRRIPNWLSVSLLAGGLASAALGVGTVAFPSSVAGAAVGLGLMFVPFALGALGGGDVKLLAAVGAWVGPVAALEVFAAAAIVGMIIVLVQAVAQGRIGVLLRNSAVLAVNLVHMGDVGVEHVTATGRDMRGVEKPLPYAVPILVATMIVIWVGGGGAIG